MSLNRENVPAYDFSCSHIESFFAYFQDLSLHFGLDISREQTLFGERVLKKVRMCVDEEFVDSVQSSCLKIKPDQDENDSIPRLTVYVTSSKHFEQLVKSKQMEEKNFLLLILENDNDVAECLNVPDGILFATTTIQQLEDDINDLLEQWVCQICYLMVKNLQCFTETEGNFQGIQIEYILDNCRIFCSKHY